MSSSDALRDEEIIHSDEEGDDRIQHPYSDEETGAEQDTDFDGDDPEQDKDNTPGRWEGSSVTSEAINWLYTSRRVPPQVACRIPGDEIEPRPQNGERVVFLAHFQRGFGLPVSDFFDQFLHAYELQPHHLPANAIFHLSCFATFSEAYLGLWPTVETWRMFFSLRATTVPDKKKKIKDLVQCGAASIQPKAGSRLP